MNQRRSAPKDELTPRQRVLLCEIQLLNLEAIKLLIDVVRDIQEMLDEGYSEGEVLQYLKRNYPAYFD